MYPFCCIHIYFLVFSSKKIKKIRKDYIYFAKKIQKLPTIFLMHTVILSNTVLQGECRLEQSDARKLTATSGATFIPRVECSTHPYENNAFRQTFIKKFSAAVGGLHDE